MNTFKRKALSAAILAGLGAVISATSDFLTLGHAAPPGEDPPVDPPADTDPLEDVDLDPPADPPDDPDARGASGEDDDPVVLRERLRTTERERDEARRAAEDERRRQAAPPPAAQPTTAQRLYAQEEEELRNPQLDANRRWQIEANRTLRANHETSQNALRAAEDLRDQTHYNGLVATNPVAKKYAKRVEEKLTEVRAGGGNLSRAVILKMLIGDDIVEGRVKPKTKRAEGEGDARVHRGQPPVTRSNVGGRGASSERDKRRARLEGKTI